MYHNNTNFITILFDTILPLLTYSTVISVSIFVYLQILHNFKKAYFIDAQNIDTSNWTRWVNCSMDWKGENVRYLYCAGKVYFLSIKDIHPGQELLMYYGDDYAKTLGITYRL